MALYHKKTGSTIFAEKYDFINFVGYAAIPYYLFTHCSYEQLTHIHPEVDEYKLYYAQVRNVCM